MPLSRRRLVLPLSAVVATTLAAVPRGSAAQAFTDPTGDFRAPYVGAGNPTTGDLDVTGGAVYFTGSSFIFTGTLAGNVPAGAPANQAYIFGVNRGGGTARFAGLGLPSILFDAVVIARPNGPDVVNIFTPASTTAIPGGATFSGNQFFVTVPVGLLPSTGFAFTDYTFNLWPRLIGQNGGDANLEIPDFAPNTSNVGIAAVVPEPATLLLVAPALAGLALVRRRRTR